MQWTSTESINESEHSGSGLVLDMTIYNSFFLDISDVENYELDLPSRSKHILCTKNLINFNVKLLKIGFGLSGIYRHSHTQKKTED